MFEREIAPLYRGDAEAQGHEFPQDPEQEERGPECGPDTRLLVVTRDYVHPGRDVG